MLSTQQKTKQIQSLVKTTSTKQQVLKKIEETPIEELQLLAPELPKEIGKNEIINNVKGVYNGKTDLSDLEKAIVEKIVLPFGRPVFFIKNGRPILDGTDIEKFKHLIQNGIDNLKLIESINSIGRIELDNHPNYSWVGTGWLFSKNLIITNRHVAEIFIEKSFNKFRFRNFLNTTVEARIDFLAEYQNNNASEFEIVDCIYIGEGQYEDIAILRVNLKNSAFKPLSILNASSISIQDPREDIAVVGYPAYDSQTAMKDDMERIYGGIYDYKRFAPGKITQVYPSEGVIVHDATTSPGNSGSALISLQTGNVVGLHFAGKESSGNFCIDAPAILRIINRIPPQRIYSEASLNSQISTEISFEANRNCNLEEYKSYKIPSFKISGRITTYASPDSTFYVTKKFFEMAQESILIGIYDFTAEHVFTCILDAIDRGVQVSLMLDLEGENETAMFKKLKKYGVECVQSPSCTSSVARYFASSHEKVIVIDNKWTLIQSGNYSNNSCPNNELDGDASQGFKTGNRDMGVVIESKPLAKFFTKVLRDDMKLQLTGMGLEGIERSPINNDFLVESPRRIPDPLFSSKEFNSDESIEIQPVLTPDNYIDQISELLRSAKKSIKIEQQYIRVDHEHIQELLNCIPNNVTVEIILAQPLGDEKSRNRTINESNTLKNDYGYDVRFLSKQFTHCHNKLIIVDDETVLISSQNWSNTAVATNREAGVIIYDKSITSYFKKIFEADWTMSDELETESVGINSEFNLESYGNNPGKFLIMNGGDVQEV